MICRNCKREIADDARFCTFCAAKVERESAPAAPRKFCTECGRPIAVEALFCTHCGARAEIHTPPAAVAAVAAPVIVEPEPVPETPAAPEPVAAAAAVAAAPEIAPVPMPEPIPEPVAEIPPEPAVEIPPAPPAFEPPPRAADVPPQPAGGKRRGGLAALWAAVAVVLVAAGIAVGIWVIRPMLDEREPEENTRPPAEERLEAPETSENAKPAPAETPEAPEAPETPAPEKKPEKPVKPAPPETPEAPKPELEEPPEEVPAPEPEPDPSPVLQLDGAQMDGYMADRASGAIWAFAVMDMRDGAMIGSQRMDEALSSSALLDIPILYAVAAMHQDGTLELDAPVRINRVTAGRTVLSGRVGQSLPLQELLCYMLQYSDNTASNALMEYLTFQTINDVCSGRGYESVSLNNYILSTTDYTANDNYVSCADLCGMLRELYTDQFPGLGETFLRENMLIQDSAAASGIGKVAPAGAAFMNLNGQKTDKYNEVAIVDDGTNAYIVAFMASHVSMDRLTAAAQTCGEYVFKTLELK